MVWYTRVVNGRTYQLMVLDDVATYMINGTPILTFERTNAHYLWPIFDGLCKEDTHD